MDARGHPWESVSFKHPSTFDTLAMDLKKKNQIMEDLQDFANGRGFYQKTGRAWKRRYLLYGPSGTGTSSMIAAMANYLGYDIYDLELTEVHHNSELRKLLMKTSSKSIIVIEDNDCSINLTNMNKNRNNGDGGDGGSRSYYDFGAPELGCGGGAGWRCYECDLDESVLKELEEIVDVARMTPADISEVLIKNRRKKDKAVIELLEILKLRTQRNEKIGEKVEEEEEQRKRRSMRKYEHSVNFTLQKGGLCFIFEHLIWCPSLGLLLPPLLLKLLASVSLSLVFRGKRKLNLSLKLCLFEERWEDSGPTIVTQVHDEENRNPYVDMVMDAAGDDILNNESEDGC
ncbi:hypothetical protein RIF29_33851 [Crotalaria pallida]|uniref:ATPase AAA-type core domain-containing protein n=1 Tax=Crotalaria pallida TaxID=3830 RepID=A0AAN9HQX9_CROPI